MIVEIMDYQNQDVKRVPGSVKLNDGTTYKGFAYVPKGKRLQDLLNDRRDFIPFELVKDYQPETGSLGDILIAKKSIASFQEVKVKK